MEHHRLFTIADLKDWIIYGKRKEGLCEEVITTTRAYSFINNPYVSDDMPVISALYVDNELAAYTAAFPEVLVKPKCTTHWFNSLYVAPKYEGKGYGLFVIGSLMECYGNDPVFDLDAVPTSIEILSYLGLLSSTFRQFNFRKKCIYSNSLRGKLALAYDKYYRFVYHRKTIDALKSRIQKASYSIKYDVFIDEESYCFIKKHAQNDAFLRTKESLNWMLRFPFVHEAPILSRVKAEQLFSSAKEWQRYYVVKVYEGNVMVGIYVLSNSKTRLFLLQLYYDVIWQDDIMLSIAEHIIKIDNAQFATTNPKVADFVKNNKLYTINTKKEISICYPKEYETVIDQAIQGGDGDMFLN